MSYISTVLKNKLVSESGTYLGVNVFSSALTLLCLPILTAYLSPYDYGVLVTLQLVLSTLSILVSVNTPGALARAFYKYERDELNAYIVSLLFISLASCCLLLLLTISLLQWKLVLGRGFELWIFSLIILSLFETWSKLLLTLWRVKGEPVKFAVFTVFKRLATTLLALFLIIHMGTSWQGSIISALTVGLVFGCFALYSLWPSTIRNIRKLPRLNFIYVRHALTFGLPLILHSLSGWVMNGIDRLFIAKMIGMSDVGVYSVAYQLGSIVGLIALSFNQAWSPFLFKSLKNSVDKTKVKIVKFTYLYFVLIILLAMLVSLLSFPLLNLFFGKAFETASEYIWWIAFGYAVNGMYYMVVNYIFYEEKNHFLIFLTLSSAVLNCLLNYVFIKHNGVVGAAQATTLTFLFTFLASWYIAAKVHKMPWNLRTAC